MSRLSITFLAMLGAVATPRDVQADVAEDCKPTEEKLVETVRLPGEAILRRFEGGCVTAACTTAESPYCGAGGSGARVELAAGGRTISVVRASNIAVETKSGSPVQVLGPGGRRGIRLELQHNGPLGGMRWVTQSTEVLAVFDGSTWLPPTAPSPAAPPGALTCDAQGQAAAAKQNAEKTAKDAACRKARAARDAELDAERKELIAQRRPTSATEQADRRTAAKLEAECLQDSADDAFNDGILTEVSKSACLTKQRTKTEELPKECATTCRRTAESVLPRYCDAVTKSRQYRRGLTKTEDEIRCREEYDRCTVRAAGLSASQRDAACGGGLNQCRATRAQENVAFDAQITAKKTACLANDRATFESRCLSACASSVVPTRP